MKAEVYCRQILEQAIRGSVPRRHGTAAVADCRPNRGTSAFVPRRGGNGGPVICRH